MVRFEKDRYVIEIPVSLGSPVEDWLGLHNELTYVFEEMNMDNAPADALFRIATLLREMMPDFATACRMMEER